uniref:Polyferredoxin n=1 Tax=uncultured organism TaxID=155900 RepID=M1QBN3_9ZZZZ|nr:polyferredoxin [uncultured organism]
MNSKNEENCLAERGHPSLVELKQSQGYPGLTQLKEKELAVIECIQEIPCNPCEKACPVGAINIGKPITNLPELDVSKCVGCRQCIAACPGLAIFTIDYNYSKTKAALSFPYEFIPYPEAGEKVEAVNRKGEKVIEAEVLRVEVEGNENTAVITIEIPHQYIEEIRSINYDRGVRDGS